MSLFSAAHHSVGTPSPEVTGHLPNSLTMLLPSALGFSPHPPVSVYGTAHINNSGFSRHMAHILHYLISLHITSSAYVTDLPVTHLPACTGLSIPGLCFPHASHSSVYMRYRNLNLLSIGYVLRPLLRPDLPRADQLYSGTLDIRPEGFPPSSRYSFRHSLFLSLHCSLPVQLRRF